MADTAQKPPSITEEEKAKRKEGIDFARHNVWLEGVVLCDEMEALNERYINGELTLQEHTAAGLKLIDSNHA